MSVLKQPIRVAVLSILVLLASTCPAFGFMFTREVSLMPPIWKETIRKLECSLCLPARWTIEAGFAAYSRRAKATETSQKQRKRFEITRSKVRGRIGFQAQLQLMSIEGGVEKTKLYEARIIVGRR